MQQRAMILNKMTRIKTINASQRPHILGSQEVSLDRSMPNNPSLFDTGHRIIYLLYLMLYEL